MTADTPFCSLYPPPAALANVSLAGTQSIPAFFKSQPAKKSLDDNSCRFNQSFPFFCRSRRRPRRDISPKSLKNVCAARFCRSFRRRFQRLNQILRIQFIIPQHSSVCKTFFEVFLRILQKTQKKARFAGLCRAYPSKRAVIHIF